MPVRFKGFWTREAKIRALRKAIVSDSVERQQDLKHLLRLIREQESEKK